MSLERIDEYMKQLKAVTDYDRVCEELEKIRKEFAERGQTLYCSESFADSLMSKVNEMQKELKEKDERIALSNVIMGKQRETIALLEKYLPKELQKAVGRLKERESDLADKVQYGNRRFDDLKNFVSLNIILDDKETILRRKMNAIYYWLFTNGLLRV